MGILLSVGASMGKACFKSARKLRELTALPPVYQQIGMVQLISALHQDIEAEEAAVRNDKL